MKAGLAVLSLFVCVTVVSAQENRPKPQREAKGRFISDSVVVRGMKIPVAVYLPPGYPSGRSWPVVLALHGAGSRGSDGISHRSQSPVDAARVYPSRYPAIFVLPQLPLGMRWTGAPLSLAFEALTRTIRNYSVDERRVYIVGQSMGSDGVFELTSQHPDVFAAAIAVSVGRGRPSYEPSELRSLPFWVFHGSHDAIPVAEARARVERLRSARNPHVRYREYPERGHDIFDDVYRDSTVSSWLFAQRR